MIDERRTLPAAPFVLILGVICLGLIWLTRPQRDLAAPLPATDVRVIVNGTDRTEELATQRVSYIYRPPESLSLADVSYIARRNGQPVLVFLDGSQLQVNEAVRNALPGSIRSRITYEGPPR